MYNQTNFLLTVPYIHVYKYFNTVVVHSLSDEISFFIFFS